MNERTEFVLSAHRELMGWLCSSPPYDLAVPVPLLLRHGDDWDCGSLHIDLAGSPYLHLHCSDLALSLGAGSSRKKRVFPPWVRARCCSVRCRGGARVTVIFGLLYETLVCDLAVAVPLLLRYGGDLDRWDRTWIWRTGWRRARPISTCIPQI